MNEARDRFVGNFQKTLSDTIEQTRLRKEMEDRAKRDSLFQQEYCEAMKILNKIPELVAKAILQNDTSVAFYEIKNEHDPTEEELVNKIFELAKEMPSYKFKTKCVNDKWYIIVQWKQP